MPDHSAVLHSPDYQALVRAVCETPEDALPRLILADFLDEAGMAKRARLIRLQLETDGGPQDATDEVYRLLDAFRWPDWRLTPYRPGEPWLKQAGGWAWPTAVVRRGMVEMVCMRWLTFARDAAELFAAQPILHVMLAEKVPLLIIGVGCRWYACEADVPDQAAGDAKRIVLPEEVWQAAPDVLGRLFLTDAEAFDALSGVLVSWGRRAAGLPVLEGYPVLREEG